MSSNFSKQTQWIYVKVSPAELWLRRGSTWWMIVTVGGGGWWAVGGLVVCSTWWMVVVGGGCLAGWGGGWVSDGTGGWGVDGGRRRLRTVVRNQRISKCKLHFYHNRSQPHSTETFHAGLCVVSGDWGRGSWAVGGQWMVVVSGGQWVGVGGGWFLRAPRTAACLVHTNHHNRTTPPVTIPPRRPPQCRDELTAWMH